MLKNSLYAFTSSIVRFTSNGILLLLLAREWGPTTFGEFILPYIIANVLGLVVDYGFNLHLVKDISKEPEKLNSIFYAALFAKNTITAMLLIAVTLISLVLNYWNLNAVMLGVLLLASVCNSYGVFYNLIFRGLSEFGKETKNIILSETFLIATITILLYLVKAGPLLMSVGFLLSRIAYLSISAISGLKPLTGAVRQRYNLTQAMESIKEGLPYSLQTVIGFMYFYIDTLVIQYVIGSSGVGIYQSGIGILAIGLKLSDILAGIYLVELSKNSKNQEKLKYVAKQMLRHLVIVGNSIFIIMIFGGQIIVKTVYGSNSDFDGVLSLMPYFSLSLLLRYLLYTYATVLTVIGKQFERMMSGLIALL
ncbi:MAG: oligosaccharide flippase family protein, partial [Cyanobacteria bacterium P01_D01_bin.123]